MSAPGGMSRVSSVALRVRGCLDADRLERCLTAVAVRHAASDDSYRATPPCRLVSVDLRGTNEQEQLTKAGAFVNHEAQEDGSSSGPLVRLLLLMCGDDDQLLLLIAHSQVYDEESLVVLMGDIAETYHGSTHELFLATPSARQAAGGCPVPSLGEVSNNRIENFNYWRRQLDRVSMLNLAADGPSGVDPCDVVCVSDTLSQHLSDRLANFSRAVGAAPYAILLTVFQLLIGRLGDVHDVVMVSRLPVPTAETARDVGPFVRTVGVRTNLSSNLSFRELVVRVCASLLDALIHGDLPVELLAHGLGPVHARATQVLFEMRPSRSPITRFGGLDAEYLDLASPVIDFVLALRVRNKSDVPALYLHGVASLFTRERLSRMLGQLTHLLDQVMDDPDRLINDLSLVCPVQAALLPDLAMRLHDCKHPTVRQMIDVWVATSPDAVAVEQGDCSCTYAELALLADGIAAVLIARGLRRGDAVAVYGPHSLGLVAAMVAVFSSGGVMLTLDRKLPWCRTSTMLTQAQATFMLLVEQDGDSGNVPIAVNGLEIIHVDAVTGQVRGRNEGSAAVVSAVSPDDPSHIVFTSGSTGVPKGVIGRHNSVSHVLAWHRGMFGIAPGDRWPLIARLSFDPVVRDVFLPLISGATLCLAVQGDELPLDEAAAWLAKTRITCVHLCPTVAEAWLGTTETVISTMLRCTSFAGEPLIGKLVHRWRTAFPSTWVVNLYGLTENVLAKCWYEVPDNCHAGVQPVGWPLPGGQALVLGPGHRLCGIGEVGEIVLRSPYQSFGYLGQGDEQAAPYISNPHVVDPGDLLWPTGDKGRYRLDGSIEILGRIDQQVKIRGVRVEPGEIAAVLAAHPDVREAAVKTQLDKRGTEVLVGYAVSTVENKISQAALREYLRQRLPVVMVPSAFVLLDSIPRTASNKIDFQALPPAALARTEGEAVAPRTATEETLCNLWAQVLEVDRVGTEQDFFDLGGDSLRATQLVSSIRRSFAVEVSLPALFDASTVAGLGTVVDREMRCNSRTHDLPIVAEGGDRKPLSFAQQRMWFLDQLTPGNPFYNVTTAFRLHGSVDVDALRRALDGMVQRHEVLRTRFESLAGEPCQVVQEPRPVALEVGDISHLAAGQRDEEARLLVQTSAERSFDLSHGEVLRAGLVQIAEADHVLWVTLHHIVCDGWAEEIFFRELTALYREHADGVPALLPVLPIQYGDYAVWQRRTFDGPRLAPQLKYWRERLGTALPGLSLRTDHSRPATLAHRRAVIDFRISGELAEALRQLSRRENATLYMTLLAAFHVLLFRWTGITDIVVGTPIANRTRTELEELIGFFDNTLLMRADLSNDPVFRELLAQVRNDAVAAYAHQDLPFEQLVEHLRPRRQPSRNPLTQILFVLQNVPEKRLGIADAVPLKLNLGNHIVGFHLMCSCVEVAKGIDVTMEYSADLFDGPTIEAFGAGYLAILGAVVADPQVRLDAIPLLDDTQRRSVLALGTGVSLPLPGTALAHHLVEQQSTCTPDAIAVEDTHQRLRYAELNRRADELASRLRAFGMGPESVVAVCLQPTAHLVIAILGVWKAGCAFLPLDPQQPLDRLALMAADARAELIVTDTDRLAALQALLNGRTVCCLDRSPEMLAADGVVSTVTPDNLACVYYTSGSTGMPKGVMFVHRDLVSYTLAIAREYQLGPQDRFLQLASIGFDVLIEEIIPVLATGGTVVFPKTPVLADGTDLATYLDAHAITCVELTTAYWHEWVDELVGTGRVPPPGLRLVITGGERILPERWAQWWQRFETPLLHIYGLTEATVTSTVYRPSPADRCETFAEVPIGRPIGNTRVHVLDGRLQPVPVGVPGELYIGGIGPARGYLRRPQVTSERFVPDPFGEAGRVLYRTGDLGRLRGDGNLEFLGRVDRTVKVRGHRVEPGEVESVLTGHPAVREVVVVMREDRPGDKQLVAYVVMGDDSRPRTAIITDLRELLRRRLPQYMVPTAIVTLDALPLNIHGKVDHHVLPCPGRADLGLVHGISAPRNPTESRLAKTMADVLGIDRVGIHDDFFALGGNSLLFVRLAAQIRSVFGVDVPVRDLFAASTGAELAVLIDGLPAVLVRPGLMSFDS